MTDLILPEEDLIPPEEIWRFSTETIKSDIASLAYPFFLVSDKVTEPQKIFTDDFGNTITLLPSERGYATINDADILIAAMSALMKIKENGEEITNTLKFYGNDYLKYTRTTRGGTTYDIMDDSLFRLLRTSVVTNIKNGKGTYKDGFNFLQNYHIGKNGNKLIIEIVLCDWLIDAINTEHILTLEEEYFLIRNSIEKRLYQLFRKYYGLKIRNQPFSFGFDKLKMLMGTNATNESFNTMLKRIEKKQNIPGYNFTIKKNINNKYLLFINRKKEVKINIKNSNQLEFSNLIDTSNTTSKKQLPVITNFFKKSFEKKFPNEEFEYWRQSYYKELRRNGEESKGRGDHFIKFVETKIQIK